MRDQESHKCLSIMLFESHVLVPASIVLHNKSSILDSIGNVHIYVYIYIINDKYLKCFATCGFIFTLQDSAMMPTQRKNRSDRSASLY